MNGPEPAFQNSLRVLAATHIADMPPESVGSVIGPYKLLQQIGQGGFGVVYMAEQEKPVRRIVALKIIKPRVRSAPVDCAGNRFQFQVWLRIVVGGETRCLRSPIGVVSASEALTTIASESIGELPVEILTAPAPLFPAASRGGGTTEVRHGSATRATAVA